MNVGTVPSIARHAMERRSDSVGGLIGGILMTGVGGGCERIAKTPTPLGLVLLVERLIALYLATLPFMLLGRVELFTPLVTILIAYPILMIDALAAEFDDPFGHDANDLPLTRICATLERDLLGTEPPPEMVFPGAAPAAED